MLAARDERSAFYSGAGILKPDDAAHIDRLRERARENIALIASAKEPERELR